MPLGPFKSSLQVVDLVQGSLFFVRVKTQAVSGFDEQKPVGAILKWNTSGLSPSLHPGNKAGQLQIIQQGL